MVNTFLRVTVLCFAMAPGIPSNAMAKSPKSLRDVGIVGPGSEMIIFYRDENDIVIRNCGKDFEKNAPLLKPNASRQACAALGAENRVPVDAFKRVLRSVFLITDAEIVKPLTADEVKAYRSSNLSQLDALKQREKELDGKLKAIQTFVDAGSDDQQTQADKATTAQLLTDVRKQLTTSQAGEDAVKKVNALIDDLVDRRIAATTLSMYSFAKAGDQYLYSVLKQFDAGRPECGTDASTIVSPYQVSPRTPDQASRGAGREIFISNNYAPSNTIDDRIKDCSVIPGSLKTTKTRVEWNLVSRKRDESSGKFYEVWRDSATGLLWGDKLETDLDHYHSVALACKVDSLADYVPKNCPVTYEKACDSEEGHKANAGILEQSFGLPTIQEFIQAENDGIREVVPNMVGHNFWSATLGAVSTLNADVFSGDVGKDLGGYFRKFIASVRCVSR